MTKEDIISMYEKANGWSPEGFDNTVKELESFARLVAAAEREACAVLCFKMWNDWMDDESISELNRPDAEDCAHAIRARGQT
jgi:hypothetical protein